MIERANKYTGDRVEDRKIIQSGLEGLMDIEVVSLDRQTGTNFSCF